MKLSTMVGGVTFVYTSTDDFIKQLEKAVADIDKQLSEFDKLKKKKWFMTKAIQTLKGEEAPTKEKDTAAPR